MRRLLWLATLVLAPLVSAAPVSAQTTRADTAAVLLDVATHLRAEGRTSLSTSLLDLIIQRYAGTPAEEAARRLRADTRVAIEERSGRAELLVWSTAYGLALGAGLPAAFDSDEPAAYGVGLLLGGPAGFGLGRLITSSRPISEGQARAITFGSLWGAWQAFGWREVFEIGQNTVCLPEFPDNCFKDDADGSTVVKAAIVGSLAGIGTGLYLARKEIPSGTATTVNLGALWGSWFGVATAVIANLDDGDKALTASLIGGNAGLVTTALLAPKWNLSRGRARLISIAGVAGGLAGAGVLLIAQPEDEGMIGIPLAGSIAGLALGARWTRNYDERGADNGLEEDGGSALLHWRDGSVKLGTPTPSATLLRNESGSGPRLAPAVHVPIFRARW